MPERFWSRVDQSGGPQRCWPWIASRHRQGYGRFYPPERPGGVTAHAYALQLSSGEQPGGRHALHSCDNPCCCNPAHLRWGTHSDNMCDVELRGRRPTTKLTPDLVRAMRAEPKQPLGPLAAKYGVSVPTVSEVLNRNTWRFV